MTTWILVADAARARIFQKGGPGQKIAEVRVAGTSRITAENLRARERSARPSRQGRDRRGRGVDPPWRPTPSLHEAEANQFAAILAQTLEQGIDRKEYARLVMVAPPHFLGTLRAAISGRVAKAVTETVNQDYTHLNEKDLSASARSPSHSGGVCVTTVFAGFFAAMLARRSLCDLRRQRALSNGGHSVRCLSNLFAVFAGDAHKV